MYEVQRHGGNVDHEWRTMKKTPYLELAERYYDEAFKKMRQGGVRIVRDGEVVKMNTAPRLRTRW